jgi:hypothetical protein
MTGCLEYHTTTEVRSDGSILRTVVIRGDSASTHAWKFVLPVDSTWTWERAKTGDREWTLTLRRIFPSAEAFNAYASGREGSFLRSEVSVDRSFRWFTTVYQYREHFPAVNLLRSVPLSDFLAPKEIEAYLQHEVQKQAFASPGDSLALEDASDRFEAWARRNEFEALFGAVRVGVARLNDPSFPAESLTVRKDRLLEAYEALKDTGSVFDAEDFVRRSDEWMKRWKEPVVRRAAAAARDSIDAIVARLAEMHRLTEFPHKSTVLMPGLLTSTNARSIDGSSARWEDYLVALYFQDYTLEAESVVTNWWAVAVTAIVAVGVPLVWIVVRRRRR